MNFKIHLTFSFLFSSFLFAEIKGTVMDQSTDEPLQGVNITGEKTGTATNESGEFSIDVPHGTELEFSHIGYHSISQLAKNGMSVEMSPAVIKSGEIIVRAGLSDESLQKTTASVTVFTPDDIRESAADHFQTLIDQIPNLNWAGGTSRPRYFQIRGIGERSQYFGEGSPNHSVSYEIDGIDLSGIGMVGGMIDIDQIEVARGSQSTVFGNNAIAGSITLSSTEPERKNSINLYHKLGSDNLKNTGITANLKGYKGLLFRVSLYKNYQDGFRKNKFFDVRNTNKKDETFLRLKMNLGLNENITVKNTVLLSNMDNGYDAWAPDNNDEYITYTDQPGKDSQKTKALASKLVFNQKDFSVMVKISSSYSELVHSYDGDWGNNAFWEDSTTYGFDSYYHGYYLPNQYFDKTNRSKRNTNTELRIYNQKAVVGIYLKNLVEKDEAEGYLFGGEGNVARANSDYDIDVKAFYAKLKSNLTKKVSIANSFRYESNDITYLGQSFGYANDTIPSVDASKRFNLNGFKSSITYNLNSYSNLFAHVSLGYKTGGVNQQPYVSTENRIYSPEYLSSYEISFKNKTDRFFTSLSYFYNDRIDQQLSISAQQNASDPNSFYYFTTNSGGKGFSRGVEIDFNAKISNRLSLKTALAYLDTWTNKFSYTTSNNNVQSGGGREAAMAPKISSSATLTYKHNLLFITLSQNYKDEYYYSDSHDQKSVPYSLLNLTLGKSFGKTTATIWIRNAMDERYTTRGFYFKLIPPTYPDELWKSYGDPRQIGVTIDYTF